MNAPRTTESVWDWPLIAIAALTTVIGLLSISSAGSAFADAYLDNRWYFVQRQAFALAGGVLVGGALLFVSKRSLLAASGLPQWLLTFVLLILVMVPGIGRSVKGAQRWIDLGVVNFQPTELAKLALVLALARFFAGNEGRLRDVAGAAFPAVAWMLPFALCAMWQKDFGTIVLLLGTTAVMSYVAGLEVRWLALAGGLATIPLGLLIAMEPYRVERVLNFTNPFLDADGSGYQVVQGWIALATGGLTGAGLGAGVAQRGFLPEAHTDMLAAVIGEEMGAIGWAIVVALQAGLLYRVFLIAQRSTQLFDILLASGVGALLGAQAVINFAVIGGLMPTKGLVLPLLSYGSSAAFVHVLSLALVLRLDHERRLAALEPALAAPSRALA